MSDRTNEQWLSDLKSSGPTQEAALTDLRSVLRAGLPYALSRYLSPGDPQFDSLAEEVVQDALLRILDNLDTFEGRSKFTTWAHKITLRLALSELRRKRWEDVSLESMIYTEERQASVGLLADTDVGPELAAEQADMMNRIERIILEELTEKQRMAMVASQIHGMPLDVVAQRMDMNRNALYKLLHDARLRLKKRMAEEGLAPEDVLSSFESR